MKKRILELDIFRGLAAILVVMFHVTMGRPEAKYGWSYGVTGVDLFFIISGYVILLTAEKCHNWKHFVFNRFSRLYPVYWSAVTFTTALIYFSTSMTNPDKINLVKKYVVNLSMFQHFFRIGNIDDPYWTLIVEMLFYLFIAFFVVFRQLQTMVPWSTGLLLFCIITYPNLWTAGSQVMFNTLHDRVPLLNHFPLFFSGILFYIIKNKKHTYIHYWLLLLCFLAQILLFPIAGRAFKFITQLEYCLPLSIYFVLFILFIQENLRWIIIKPLIYLGNISFGLYLVHQYLSLYVLIPFATNKLHLSFWYAVLLFTLPLILLVATISYFGIEKPSLRSLRTRFNKKYQSAEIPVWIQ